MQNSGTRMIPLALMVRSVNELRNARTNRMLAESYGYYVVPDGITPGVRVEAHSESGEKLGSVYDLFRVGLTNFCADIVITSVNEEGVPVIVATKRKDSVCFPEILWMQGGAVFNFYNPEDHVLAKAKAECNVLPVLEALMGIWTTPDERFAITTTQLCWVTPFLHNPLTLTYYTKLKGVIIKVMPRKRISTTLITFSLSLFLGSTVFAGTTPPTTTHIQTPLTPDGNNDWHVTPITFDLSATDLESGVKEINYRVDGGTWQKVEFSGSLNLAPNPSFETSGATSSGLASWDATLVDGDTTYTQGTTNFTPGYSTASAKILTTTPTSGLWHGINNKTVFAVATAFESMTASVWMKTENVNETAYFKIFSIADDGLGGEVITLLGSSASLSGTNGWTFLSLDFTTLPDLTTGIYIDIGLAGAGTVWADAVTINSSIQIAQTQLIIASDNVAHTLEYYSVDQVGNIETSSCTTPKSNCVEFKMDMTSPGNWNDFGAFRGGNEHELFVFANVADVTSGLSSLTDQYQYKLDDLVGFGVYSDLQKCSSTWISNGWADLGSPPVVDGDSTAYLETQLTEFCDNDWKVCKTVRFEAEDMAGNTSTREFCINGPWIRVTGEGIVRSNHNIDMLAAPPDGTENTDGLLEAGGTSIDSFNTTKNWMITNSAIPSLYDYDRFWNLSSSQTEITDGNLISSTGTYYVNGSYEIKNAGTPNDYDDATFNQIVFINGDLTISNDIKTALTSTALFIVKGNVSISKNVDEIAVGVFSDGIFDTAYDLGSGSTHNTLQLNGLFSADTFLLKRTIGPGSKTNPLPSEDFIFEPKFLVQLKDFFGKNTITWRSAE